ncbi:MAG: L-ascorbate metabolism protein UlaG (beta-lactamase superfamily) [Myxococcota bacterium]|jgi:L-ascorbate metabolism protein UlaG (beta-lactamase superfamily)
MNIFLLALLTACDNTEPETAPAPEVHTESKPEVEVDDGAVVVGPFTVTPIYHGTTMVTVGDVTIWIDPWSKAALDDVATADVVLITDIHSDHYDEEAIAKVVDAETVFVAPAAVSEKRAEAVQHVLANGEQATVAGITITAVAMYNLERGPESGGLYHDKGRGNGYILEMGDTRVYFAGDTECTDEMKALVDIDAAFLPMNLPYTMTPEEAAGCVAAFKPALAVPYHYAGSDLTEFSGGVEGVEGVEVRIVEFYPGGLPW